MKLFIPQEIEFRAGDAAWHCHCPCLCKPVHCTRTSRSRVLSDCMGKALVIFTILK